jgi:hypothetical protein
MIGRTRASHLTQHLAGVFLALVPACVSAQSAASLASNDPLVSEVAITHAVRRSAGARGR